MDGFFDVFSLLIAFYGAYFIYSWFRTVVLKHPVDTNNILPADFPHELLCRIYREVIESEYPQGERNCPMSDKQWKETLDPKRIIANRRTSGGPQPAELNRCLNSMQSKINAHAQWADQAAQRIDESLKRLDQDFAQFLS